MTDSPIRWAGSKRGILHHLREFWRPTDKKYIEAFAGSACLFFSIAPKCALLNDANSELIGAFRVLAERPRSLYESLLALPSNAQTYYAMRSSKPVDSMRRAVRFFYLNRHCFNGIYRTNKSGEFNVPFGKKTGRFPEIEEWLACAELLKTAHLTNLDFEDAVLENLTEGSFVYMDPPYAVANRRVFSQYSANEFGQKELVRLVSLMRSIDKAGATFVVSYALSKETSLLARGWYSTRRLTQRNVAGFSRHRKKAVEVLITNDDRRVPTGNCS